MSHNRGRVCETVSLPNGLACDSFDVILGGVGRQRAIRILLFDSENFAPTFTRLRCSLDVLELVPQGLPLDDLLDVSFALCVTFVFGIRLSCP